MLGDKIHAARKKKGLTIAELAEEVGISKGHISQIERNRMEPSLAVLRKLSAYLSIPMNVLFGEQTRQDVSVIKKDERTVIAYGGSRVRLELLTPSVYRRKENAPLSVAIYGIPPGERMDRTLQPGDCEEFIYVLEGVLTYQIGSETVQLYRGDSVYVPNNTDCFQINESDEAVKLLWSVVPVRKSIPADRKPGIPTHTGSREWRVAGEKIRKQRISRGMKAGELAAAAGISSAHMSRIERDKTEPSMGVLRDICTALNVSIPSLLSNVFTSDIVIMREADRKGFTFVQDNTVYLFESPVELADSRLPTMNVYQIYLSPQHKALPDYAMHPDRDELMYVLKGAAVIRTEEDAYHLNEGDSIYIPRGVSHSTHNADGQETTIFTFNSSYER